MKPGEEWIDGHRLAGCKKGTGGSDGCFWIIPLHGPPEHWNGTLERGRRILLAREKIRKGAA